MNEFQIGDFSEIKCNHAEIDDTVIIGKNVNIESDGSLVASCNPKIHQQLISIINS